MTKENPTLGAKLASGALKARRVFFKMSMREKVLFLLFCFALVAVWFTWQLGRHESVNTALATAKSISEQQELMLSYGPEVRARYNDLISQFDLQSLPTRDEMSGQIDALVRDSGFTSFSSGDVRTEEGAGFRFHTIQLAIQQATIQQIKSFTEAVKSELPFVSLERVSIQAQASNDSFLDVRYVFKSIEYTQ